MPDIPQTTLNTTPTLQSIATFNGVQTTMDTCVLTLYTPNLQVAQGPLALTAISTGFYQFTLPLGTLNLVGVWSATWYVQKGTQSLQTTEPFKVTP